jgi:hypothetical protein
MRKVGIEMLSLSSITLKETSAMKINILLSIIPLFAGVLLLAVGFEYQVKGAQSLAYVMIVYGFIQHIVNTRRLNETRRKALSLDKVL